MGYDSYSWSTGETSQEIIVNVSGEYSVDVSNFNYIELEGFSYGGYFNGSNYYVSNNSTTWSDRQFSSPSSIRSPSPCQERERHAWQNSLNTR